MGILIDAHRRVSHPPAIVTPMNTGLVIALVGAGGAALGAFIGAVTTTVLSSRETRKAENRATVRGSANELLSALGAVPGCDAPVATGELDR
jgi:hypothetical protein